MTTAPKDESPARLIDLHTDWMLQYAQESTTYDASLYERVKERLGQAEGYLQGTWAAVLSCYRRAEDWAQQTDPWRALGELIARIEAEFPGRLLMGSEDLARFFDDPEGLCWGVIGVEGFDALVREEADLDRLVSLFERGVRLFQPVYTSSSLLAGSSASGDDRGLTELGRRFLSTLESAVAAAETGPRCLVDLAHLNPRSASEVLAWFEADASRLGRLLPIYSHGAIEHDGFDSPRALSRANLVRLRTLGGYVALSVSPPFYNRPEQLRADLEAAASVPFLGAAGFHGIAIGSDFLGVDQTLPGLSNAIEVVDWLGETFDPATAAALRQGNALNLLRWIVGNPVPAS